MSEAGVITWIKTTYKMDGMLFILLIIVMGFSLIFLLPYSVNKAFVDPDKFYEFGIFC